MDHSDQSPGPYRWSIGGAPMSDALLPPGDETQPDAEADSASEAPGETRASVTPSFLVELATAMHAAADQESERIANVVAEEGAAHIDRARARAAVEAEELRRFADEDLQRISEWADAEIERVRTEAAQRADERRAALDEYIRQHEAIIDTEIQGVDGALAEYRVTLQQFFSELTSSTDPAEIARRAGALPPAPDLDDVRANARAEAVARLAQTAAEDDETNSGPVGDLEGSRAESLLAAAPETPDPENETATVPATEVQTPLVGVMDPEASRQSGPPDVLVHTDAAVEDAADAAGDASQPETISAADTTDEEPQPVTAAAGSPGESGPAGRLLRTIATWTAPSDPEDRRVVDEPDDQPGSDRAI